MKIMTRACMLGASLTGLALFCSVLKAAPVGLAAVSQIGKPHGSGGGGSYAPQFTADGNSLLFLSHARNLVTNDSGNRLLHLYSLNLSNNDIRLISAANGAFENGSAGIAAVSSNGQFVVFESAASNLTLNDTNGSKDIFVRDLATGIIALMSSNTNGTGPGNSDSANPVISADGRWVAFESRAKDLGPVNANSRSSVFLRDRISGAMISASYNSDFGSSAYSPILTPNGSKMAFLSTGAFGTSAAPNALGEVYIRQNPLGPIYWAGRGLATNIPSPYGCLFPQISDNGQQVLFKVFSQSNQQTYVCFFDNSNYVNLVIATNANPTSLPVFSGNARLVVSENNSNVFLWNLETGTNQLISANVAGTGPGNGPSYNPVVSRDFTRVAFLSEATDLTTNASNGKPQIYVRDLISGVTRLATMDTNRVGSGDFTGAEPVISPSGDLVPFDAPESNLAPDDQNQQSDVFIYAWTNDAVQLVTRAVPGKPNKTGGSISLAGSASVSGNGRYVAFSTLDTNVYPVPTTNVFNSLVWDTWQNRNLLLEIYTNPPSGSGSGFLQTSIGAKPPVISEDGSKLIYVVQDYDYLGNSGVGYLYSLDLGTGSRTLIGQSRDLISGPISYMSPAASADGRYIVFQSDATTLSSHILDTNSQSDVFIYDSVSATTNLLSISMSGTVGNGASVSPLITPDGKWAFFRSTASNLSTNLPASYTSVNQRQYARDLVTGNTYVLGNLQIDYSSPGNLVVDSSNRVVFFEAFSSCCNPRPVFILGFDLTTRSNIYFSTNSSSPSLSANGRFLAYEKNINQSVSDVYLRDLQTGKESLISSSFDGGTNSNGICTNIFISPDARFIVFSSTASNLVPNDDNGVLDVFVRDRLLGVTTLLSRNLQGTGPGSGASFQPVLSRDGRTVVFQSFAGDLAEGDYNNFRDVFVAKLGGIDSDGDGMDDDWEVAYFGDLSRNGTGDFDGDGQTDFQEFLAGTNPKNDSSILRVMTVSGINSGVVTILWNAVPGKIYRVQYKDDLTGSGWTDLNGLVTATSSTGSKQDTQPSAQRFYRVVAGVE